MWVVTLPSTPVSNDLLSQVRGLKGGRVDDGRRQVQEEGQEVDVDLRGRDDDGSGKGRGGGDGK